MIEVIVMLRIWWKWVAFWLRVLAVAGFTVGVALGAWWIASRLLHA